MIPNFSAFDKSNFIKFLKYFAKIFICEAVLTNITACAKIIINYIIARGTDKCAFTIHSQEARMS